ncbi:MAG: glycosyltransferase [Acutalibacteraceae bacterium]|nr:glycosyltransferase [Acutalibacteraceae bacterium]
MTVSVALALYNGEKFIEKQLDTLRLQTVKPNQVVLCDDGSSDNTVNIVNEYINKYSLGDSWKVCKNPQNLGYAKNFYHAMDLCDGDLIYLCDQDDIWKNDKIEKMNKVMEENPNISLLMCKGGVIGADDRELHGMMIKKADETEKVTKISVEDIIRIFDWTGMLMCVRKEFFEQRKSIISEISAPHDFVLALSAADCEQFYVYDYVGAYHRRHDNNAANEEHRISKILNLKRKIRDIDNYNGYLYNVANSNIEIQKNSMNMLEERLIKSQQRKQALEEKNIRKLFKLYFSDDKKMLRPISFLCDTWLVLFGRI